MSALPFAADDLTEARALIGQADELVARAAALWLWKELS